MYTKQVFRKKYTSFRNSQFIEHHIIWNCSRILFWLHIFEDNAYTYTLCLNISLLSIQRWYKKMSWKFMKNRILYQSSWNVTIKSQYSELWLRGDLMLTTTSSNSLRAQFCPSSLSTNRQHTSQLKLPM